MLSTFPWPTPEHIQHAPHYPLKIDEPKAQIKSVTWTSSHNKLGVALRYVSISSSPLAVLKDSTFQASGMHNKFLGTSVHRWIVLGVWIQAGKCGSVGKSLDRSSSSWEELIRDWQLFCESGERLAANMTQMFVSHRGYEMPLNAFENKELKGCLITALLTPQFATV